MCECSRGLTPLIQRRQGPRCHTMDLVSVREKKKWEQEEIIKAPCALKLLAEGMRSERVTTTQKEGGTGGDKDGGAGRCRRSHVIGKVVHVEMF